MEVFLITVVYSYTEKNERYVGVDFVSASLTAFIIE